MVIHSKHLTCWSLLVSLYLLQIQNPWKEGQKFDPKIYKYGLFLI